MNFELCWPEIRYDFQRDRDKNIFLFISTGKIESEIKPKASIFDKALFRKGMILATNHLSRVYWWDNWRNLRRSKENKNIDGKQG